MTNRFQNFPQVNPADAVGENPFAAEQAADRAAPELNTEIKALREDNAKLRAALIDARASFLGLQPDFGGPVAAQMGKAIERINAALT